MPAMEKKFCYQVTNLSNSFIVRNFGYCKAPWETTSVEGRPSLKGIDIVKSWPGPGQTYNLLYLAVSTHPVSLCS